MPDHITDEFDGADLKDRRLGRRLRKIVCALAGAPSASISAACGGWAEVIGACRFFNSKKATPAALLAPHQAAVARRCAQHPCIIVSQDTTELDFTHMQGTAGLGPLNSEERRGFFMHSLYVGTEEGLPLGLLDAAIMTRNDDNFRITETRKKRPIEEKESYRWLVGYRRTCELARTLPEGSEVFSVSDREGDIYEVFEARQLALEAADAAKLEAKKKGQKAGDPGGEMELEAVGPVAHWLIRANQDRALLNVEGTDPARLFAALAASPALGNLEFEISAKNLRTTKKKGLRVSNPRSARRVRQTIRVLKITPRPPRKPGGGKSAPVTFWALLAEEQNPPEGQDAVSWVLLTSKPVESFEEACRMMKIYLRRWDIEVFHRVLKTGCRVEKIQLKEADALIRALMIYVVIAWRILYLTHLGRRCPDLPCGLVFEEAEWKATCAVVKRSPEKGEPTLGEFMGIVGKLGGHLGRKNDGPPGPQSIWIGTGRIRDFALAWHAVHDD